MARAEDRFGEVTGLGTSYTSVGGPVPSATMWNTHINLANRKSTKVYVRLYVADTSWTSGEPTGGALKAAIAYDLPLAPGEIKQITGVILLTTEELVARSSQASSVDILLSGVAIT